ncbi:MAG TPA: bifunctional DNA primase/polymerase, partial [Streptomyces sp.]|nr:bifunctional DNA primase/polymerase [Streptomyces sp.]
MTHDARSALLRAALAAAGRGWHVFPLRPGSKVPAGHAAARCP